MMAAGKRPVPFRTRKLSPPAPMVLHSGGCGRVGYRRPNNFKHSTPPWTLYGPRRGAFCHPTGCVAVGRHSSGWNEFVINARFSGVCPGGGNSITTSFQHTTGSWCAGCCCHTRGVPTAARAALALRCTCPTGPAAWSYVFRSVLSPRNRNRSGRTHPDLWIFRHETAQLRLHH